MSIAARSPFNPESAMPYQFPTSLNPAIGALRALSATNSHDYTARQGLVLLTLGKAYPNSWATGGLANATGISKPAVTRAVAALAALGMLTNRVSALDRRINVVALTEAGLAQIQALGAAAQATA
jgi:DNA-binding MarR family transcriptional regulator